MSERFGEQEWQWQRYVTSSMDVSHASLCVCVCVCVCVKPPASCKHVAHQKQLLFLIYHPSFKFCFYTVLVWFHTKGFSLLVLNYFLNMNVFLILRNLVLEEEACLDTILEWPIAFENAAVMFNSWYYVTSLTLYSLTWQHIAEMKQCYMSYLIHQAFMAHMW